jgi:hypothetical protein
MKEVNKHLTTVKNNPLSVMAVLGLLGGGGTVAKFHLFDELVRPMHSIIYHQKIGIHLMDSLSVDEARDEAEDEMIEEGFWKPRGSSR